MDSQGRIVPPLHAPQRRGWISFSAPATIFRKLLMAHVFFLGCLFGVVTSLLPVFHSTFSFSSTITGLLISCLPFGLCSGIVLTTFFVPQQKSRLMAIAVVLSGLFCILSGVVLYTGDEIRVHGQQTQDFKPLLCDESALNASTAHSVRSFAGIPGNGQLVMFGLFTWVLGVFASLPFVVGLNKAELSSRLSFITVLLGMLLGYLLGSVDQVDAHRVFVFGFLLLGSVSFVFGLLFCFVPDVRLREDLSIFQEQVPGIKINLKESARIIVGLARNWLFMNMLVILVLDFLVTSYLLQSIPSYFQSQFDIPSHVANVTTAAGFIVPLIISATVVPSGLKYLRYSRKSTRKLIMTCTTLSCVFASILVFLSCSPRNFDHERQVKPKNELLVLNICNEKCACGRFGDDFRPVCHEGTEMTFISACHAGCLNWNSVLQRYEQCECVRNKILQDQLDPQETFLVDGLCKRNCGFHFFAYITVLALMQLFSGFPLVNCLRETTSSIPDYASLQLSKRIIVLLLFLVTSTSPWLVGIFMDSTCMLWDPQVPGQLSHYRQHCALHNSDRLKTGIHIPLIFIKLLLTALLYMVHRYSEHPEEADDDSSPSVQYQPVHRSTSIVNLVEDEMEQKEASASADKVDN